MIMSKCEQGYPCVNICENDYLHITVMRIKLSHIQNLRGEGLNSLISIKATAQQITAKHLNTPKVVSSINTG